MDSFTTIFKSSSSEEIEVLADFNGGYGYCVIA
jgi:hypothetical protein